MALEENYMTSNNVGLKNSRDLSNMEGQIVRATNVGQNSGRGSKEKISKVDKHNDNKNIIKAKTVPEKLNGEKVKCFYVNTRSIAANEMI